MGGKVWMTGYLKALSGPILGRSWTDFLPSQSSLLKGWQIQIFEETNDSVKRETEYKPSRGKGNQWPPQMVKEKEKRQEEDSVLFVEGYEIAMAIAEAKCRSRRRKRTIIKLGWRLLQTAQIVSNNASENNKIVCVKSNRLRPFSTVLKADVPPLYAPTDLVEIAPCAEMKHSMPLIKCLASPSVAVVPAHRTTSIRPLLVFHLHQYENLIKKRHDAMRAARWPSFEDDETGSKYIPFSFVPH